LSLDFVDMSLSGLSSDCDEHLMPDFSLVATGLGLELSGPELRPTNSNPALEYDPCIGNMLNQLTRKMSATISDDTCTVWLTSVQPRG